MFSSDLTWLILVLIMIISNQFPVFPPAEKNIIARLYLGGNRLDSFSDTFISSSKNALVELDVNANMLTEISLEIGLLKNLKLLNASNNNLTDLPYTLGYMNALQR